MQRMRRYVPATLALILGFTTSSCLIQGRQIKRHGKVVTPGAAPVLQATTRDELTSRIRNLYNAIDSFQATVEMTPSYGSVYKGQVTDIKDVRGYVLFRKPDAIRILGQVPIVRTKEFEMASSGADFKVHIVSRNLFIEGASSAPPTGKSGLENLRPEAFLSSMLVRPPLAEIETPVLEDFTDEDNAVYILHLYRKGPRGDLMLGRNVSFDRIDLSIVRQKIFDEYGAIVSDTRYSDWKPYSNVMFPANIKINRPRDGYGVGVQILEMQMNVPLTDDKFVLTQPEGTQLRILGGASVSGPAGDTK